MEPSSFVVIDDRELEEPQDSLISNEDTEIQNAKEAKFDQEEDEITPDLTEIVSSSESLENFDAKEAELELGEERSDSDISSTHEAKSDQEEEEIIPDLTEIASSSEPLQNFDAKETELELGEEKSNPDISRNIIPSIGDVLKIIPKTKDDGSPREPTKLQLALRISPEKLIPGLNEKLLSKQHKYSTCPYVEPQPQELCNALEKQATCWSPGKLVLFYLWNP